MSARSAHAFVGVLVAGGTLVASCRSPTQIVVEVRTDADCTTLVSTSITTARADEDIEAKLPQSVRQGCVAPGMIGSIVLVPRDAEDAEVKLRVVAGLGRAADTCTPPAYEGCVVVRRQLRFESGENVRVSVNVATGCRDRPCGPDATCNEAGVCVPLTCATPLCGGDAGAPVDPGARCEDVCRPPGRCNAGRCEFTCNRPGQCRGTRCPPRVPCTIVCAAADACDDLRCGDATECAVRCEADRACRNGIRCEQAGTCDVTCRAGLGDSCDTDITCPRNPTAACNVTCNGACSGSIECCDANRLLCGADDRDRIDFDSSFCR